MEEFLTDLREDGVEEGEEGGGEEEGERRIEKTQCKFL